MRNTTIQFPLATVIAFALAGPGAPAAAIAQGGPEQAAKFAKSVDTTIKSLDSTRGQLDKTVAGYNSIIEQTAKDTKDAYKDLGKNITESENKVAETKSKVDEMNAEADAHFAAWKTSTAAISDPALRKKSEDRMTDAQAKYAKISGAGRDARQHFDTLMTDLKNQTKFLGSDLNPSGISSLKPEAAKFNTRAHELFGKIDVVSKAFADYAASLRP
jgi:chromosome segregation ATPase